MKVLTTFVPNADPPEATDIEFHALSGTEWRATDRRFPKQSVEALPGFVAKQGDICSATRMHHPFEAKPLVSLEHVAGFFVSHR